MKPAVDAPRPQFTPRQGQFLAFIHAYTLVNGRPPAEADMMRFFRLTPPSVHQMVLTLEQAGLISRQPGVARSIAVLLDQSALPELLPGHAQPVKTTVQSTLMFAVSSCRHRNSLLVFKLFSMAASEQGRRHDHETTVEHALMRGLVTAGP